MGTQEETLSSRLLGKREGPGEVAGGSAALDDHLQPAPEELWMEKKAQETCALASCAGS